MRSEMKNKKLLIAAAVSLAVLAVIVFRIYGNIRSNQERAARAAQSSAASVDVVKVQRRDITPTLVFSANLEPVWSADLSPKFDSRLDKLFVDEGDRVRSGQVVAQMDILELSAQAFQQEGLLYEAFSDSEDAAAEYERNERLFAQNAISKKELDNSRSRRDMALGRRMAAQGSLRVLKERLSAASVASPRDGVVVRRYLHEGVYVKSGSPIISVADTTVLLANADVSEGHIADIYIDADAQISVAAYQGKTFGGRVTRVSPMASLPARTFKTEISIPNDDGELRAGMFVTVAVRGKPRLNALVIPQAAVVMREDQQTVYVVNDENIVQQKLLSTGAVDGGFIEVLQGVSEGEVIVVSGQNKLRQGALIAPRNAEGTGSAP
jgi:RND family efflux transporter MFP subunit